MVAFRDKFGLCRVVVLSLLWGGWMGSRVAAETVAFQILQMNDVYELSPLGSGNQGGLARVATVRRELMAENPATFTVIAGDFFSPSALGTATVGGDRLAGKQMVAVLNHLGLDLATFGNHEFDLHEDQFLARLRESEFQWFSGNVRQATGEPWDNVPDYVIKTVMGKDGSVIKVGFIGATVPSNGADYVSYLDPFGQLKTQVTALAAQTDVIVALTHLPIADDQYLAEHIPEIDLILGGHEHENIQQWRGRDFTPIFKADANARTVYIHRLVYDTEQESLTINSQIQPITEAIAEAPDIAAVVETWKQKAFAGFRAEGFEPEAIVAQISMSLDGLESSVRHRPTNLTQLIADGILQKARSQGDVELAVFNGGSIRIDDVLPAGAIAEYDVIRILPFGGDVVTVNMRGSLLQRVLDQGMLNRGTGGYLQTAQVSQDPVTQTWLIGDRPLEQDRIYRVATVSFLISGQETGLDFLTTDNPDLTLLATHGDVRFALIEALQAAQANQNYQNGQSE